MWSTSRHVLRDVAREFKKITHSSVQYISQTSCKNTVVVERWWQVPLSKEGRPPRLYPRRHQVYKVVEDAKHTPREKMELILTQTVPKLGGRGDTVFVKKNVGRNKLLATNVAVYPSAENKEMFAEELRLLREGKPEERTQTRTGQLTVEKLKHMELKVEKKTSIEYDITKEIVCRQFLTKRGIFVPPHALKLSEEPIKDLGDYWCEVTVNGIDTVRIPMAVVPFVDPRARRKIQQDYDSVTADSEVVSTTVPEASISKTPVIVAAASVVPDATNSEVVAPTESAPTPLVVNTEVTLETEAFPPTENQKKD